MYKYMCTLHSEKYYVHTLLYVQYRRIIIRSSPLSLENSLAGCSILVIGVVSRGQTSATASAEVQKIISFVNNSAGLI